jgi:hypothetical protein
MSFVNHDSRGKGFLIIIAMFGAMFALAWLLDTGHHMNSLRTADTCVELMNRLVKDKNRTPTSDEEADMKQCSVP